MPNAAMVDDIDTDDCDVVVVGGGLVGMPLAIALAAGGWRVTLLERRTGSTALPDDPLDQRCTALSAGSVDWLTRQGLWPVLAADASPIRAVHVSQRGHFGVTRLDAAEQGLDALGQVIENRVALAAFEAALRDSDVRRLGGTRVGAVRTGADHVAVEYTSADDSSRVLRARLVIGVDGVESDVRAAVGIDARRVDYQQSAVLGTLALGRDHEGVAYERFTDSGPLALLPRPGRVVSFVECVDVERGAELAAADEARRLAHLQRRFGYRLGRFERAGPVSVVPLVRVEARRQSAPRTVLLGNAMRLLHPIAGQGYNLALRDVAQLVSTLSGSASTSLPRASTDPGEPRLLGAFVDARRADQRRVVALTDTLARTFRGESRLLGGARALALVGLDIVSPLRRGFARAAMGRRFR